jgi:hypothetical protein
LKKRVMSKYVLHDCRGLVEVIGCCQNTLHRQTHIEWIGFTNHCDTPDNACTNSEAVKDGEMIFAQTLCRGTRCVGARMRGSW